MNEIPGFEQSLHHLSHFEAPPSEEAAKTWQGYAEEALRQLKRENKAYVADTTTVHFSSVGEATTKEGLLHIPIDVSLSNPRVLSPENSDDRFTLIVNPENGHVTTDLNYNTFPTRLESLIPLYQAMERDLIHMIKNVNSYDGNRH